MADQPFRLFIIYAREDEPFRAELKAQLLPMERAGQVRVWTDRELIAGEHWEPIIKQNLKSADVILLLVSSDYFQSDYIHEVEIKEALERHDRGEAKVLPIIVRPCDWEADPAVTRLQVLPTDGNPVNDTRHWPSREAAWVDVVRGVRRTLQQLREERAEVERQAAVAEERRAAEAERRRKTEEAAEKRLHHEAARPAKQAGTSNTANSRRTLLLALGGAALMVAIWLVLRLGAENPPPEKQPDATKTLDQLENSSYQKALTANTIPALEGYLSQYSNGKNAAQARQKLSTLQNQLKNFLNDADLFMNDDPATACDYLRKALALSPGDADISKKLGKLKCK